MTTLAVEPYVRDTTVTNGTSIAFVFCKTALYMKLPTGLDDIDYAKIAARAGIFIAPGSVFCVDRRSEPAGIRVNVARADDVRFYDFLSRTLSA